MEATNFDRILHDVLDNRVPIEPVTCSVSQLIRRLESLLGAERWTLQKVRTGDFEARTWSGMVGRGMTAADALSDLAGKLGEVTYAA